MRTAQKDLAREIASLKQQLEDLAESMNGTGSAAVARGEGMIEDTIKSARDLIARYSDTARGFADDTVKMKQKAAEGIVAQAEARPMTTVAAIAGIGFLVGWLCRRSEN